MYKTKEEKWCYFEQLADAKLLQAQEIDINCHYIQLHVDPTFSNKFVLQFEILNSYVNWYCTIWKSELDRLKIYSGPLEKEMPEPILFIKKRSVSNEDFKHIHDLVNRVSISPFIEKDWDDIIDGEIYTLTIGYKSCSVSYKWHYLPYAWRDLQDLVNSVLKLILQ